MAVNSHWHILRRARACCQNGWLFKSQQLGCLESIILDAIGSSQAARTEFLSFIESFQRYLADIGGSRASLSKSCLSTKAISYNPLQKGRFPKDQVRFIWSEVISVFLEFFHQNTHEEGKNIMFWGIAGGGKSFAVVIQALMERQVETSRVVLAICWFRHKHFFSS